MTRTSGRIQSGELQLESALYVPDDLAPDAVVVVCHPHPQRGGDMHNNVVMAIVQAVYEAGISALTFNFRGVGASQGSYDDGTGERDDVKAALEFAATLKGIEHVGLAGYSFGAGMAAAVVDDSVAALALVAAPSRTIGADSALAAYSGPALLVSGDADHVSSADALQSAAALRKSSTQVEVVPGADHFWRGHEAELVEIVGAFFKTHLA